MIAKCLHNQGSQLPQPARAHLYSERTTFEVTPGEDYQLAGLGVFETVLLVLVRDDTGKPNWLPSALFQMTMAQMPSSWYLSVREPDVSVAGDLTGKWLMMMGYEELIRDPSHSDGLIERDAEALETFHRRLDVDD